MDNFLTAKICQTLVMCATGKSHPLDDFLVLFEPPEAKRGTQSWQQKFAFAKMIAMAFNAPGKNT